MFFLIRCVFWLTVVFSTIFNTDPSPVAPARQPAGAHQAELVRREQPSAADRAMSLELQSWVTNALQHIWSKAASGCAGTPAECAGIATRLADFARQHPFDPQVKSSNWAEAARSPVDTPKASDAPMPKADVPLPPMRPRNLRPLRSGMMKSAHASGAREHFSRS